MVPFPVFPSPNRKGHTCQLSYAWLPTLKKRRPINMYTSSISHTLKGARSNSKPSSGAASAHTLQYSFGGNMSDPFFVIIVATRLHTQHVDRIPSCVCNRLSQSGVCVSIATERSNSISKYYNGLLLAEPVRRDLPKARTL